MAKRLINLQQIHDEKLPRSRSWIFQKIADGEFPAPIGGTIPNLWDEAAVDEYVEKFVAEAKRRAAETGQRIEKAAKGRDAKLAARRQADATA